MFAPLALPATVLPLATLKVTRLPLLLIPPLPPAKNISPEAALITISPVPLVTLAPENCRPEPLTAPAFMMPLVVKAVEMVMTGLATAVPL